MDRDELNARPSRIVGTEPTDESQHFYVCKQCGQAVDMRRLGDVFHHEEPDHKPIQVQ